MKDVFSNLVSWVNDVHIYICTLHYSVIVYVWFRLDFLLCTRVKNVGDKIDFAETAIFGDANNTSSSINQN